MDLERAGNVLKKVAVWFAIITILASGFANTVYSDERYPTTEKWQWIQDMLITIFTNPYALLNGLVAYAFVYRWASQIQVVYTGKNDYLMLIYAALDFLLMYVLVTGKIIY
ncbi:hypothetical protein JXL21_11195 [Candidatus Bathyarchaeota archaeon]|nr:hypothetical protein [Candidatus Bathyarchaeota archaeon]